VRRGNERMVTGRPRALRPVALLAAVVALLVACAPPPVTGGGGEPALNWSVEPSVTGPGITTDPIFTHLAYAPNAPRGRLVVLLHGTGANPQGYTVLGRQLRADGHHVVVLRYPAQLSTFGGCPNSGAATDPDCHRTLRGEVVHGANVPDPDGLAVDHPLVNISAANSVTNRLLKLVEYLRTVSPTSGWEQFQQRTDGTCDSVAPAYGTCDLHWDRVVAMGHSQGAGVALYLGKVRPLDRVAMLSGSYDAFDLGGGSYTVAPWIAEGGLRVPPSRIGHLLHTGDPGIGVFRSVATALDVPGPEVVVSSWLPPYGGSRRLVTSLPPACPLDSAQNHNSTATDLCAPSGAYTLAWLYLAGS
jgi:predicted esterase